MKLKELFELKEPNETGPLIYCIQNTINGVSYIGHTAKDLYTRFVLSGSSHKSRLEQGYRSKLYDNIREYGIDNFEVYILDLYTSKTLDWNEKFYIKEFDSLEKGLNDTEGGKSFSPTARVEGAYKTNELCRNEQKGAFFNPLEHTRACSLGGNAKSEADIYQIIGKCKELGLPINEENYNIARKEVRIHNSPKWSTYQVNYNYIK